jgi:hypothetical protein
VNGAKSERREELTAGTADCGNSKRREQRTIHSFTLFAPFAVPLLIFRAVHFWRRSLFAPFTLRAVHS